MSDLTVIRGCGGLEGVVGYVDARVRLKMQFIPATQKLLEGGESRANPFRLSVIPEQSIDARCIQLSPSLYLLFGLKMHSYLTP